MAFQLENFDVEKFDAVLARGLSCGLGQSGQQVCIEAAICEVLGLGHSDDPKCVSKVVRAFKISLNDCKWSSPIARAKGLRDLGLAQLGSLDVINDRIFAEKISEKTIRVIVPTIFRLIFPTNLLCLEAAIRCENEGTEAAAKAAGMAARAAAEAVWAAEAAEAARAVWAAEAAGMAVWAAAEAARAATEAARAVWAAKAAGMAARAAAEAVWAAEAAGMAVWAADEYLNLSAKIALDVLREMNSPGIQFLEKR